jgi:hypothetical protein
LWYGHVFFLKICSSFCFTSSCFPSLVSHLLFFSQECIMLYAKGHRHAWIESLRKS